jgi:hypothetical protein
VIYRAPSPSPDRSRRTSFAAAEAPPSAFQTENVHARFAYTCRHIRSRKAHLAHAGARFSQSERISTQLRTYTEFPESFQIRWMQCRFNAGSGLSLAPINKPLLTKME